MKAYNDGFSFSVAPMMAHTNRHFRYFWRCLSKSSILYTEMVMADEIVRHRGNEFEMDRLLGHDSVIESPVILQLGGNDPSTLREAVRIARGFGYKYFNLNCGCPSTIVASESVMGASMMLNPELTADCTAAMWDEISQPIESDKLQLQLQLQQNRVDTSITSTDIISIPLVSDPKLLVYPSNDDTYIPPLSVKCRIGINDKDSYEDLHTFIQIVSQRGRVNRFQIHARKAVLGLNTKDNRLIPPLTYEFVYKLTQDFPTVQFEINGGIESVSMMKSQRTICPDLVGSMVGRACVNHPYSFVGIDAYLRRNARNNVDISHSTGDDKQTYTNADDHQVNNNDDNTDNDNVDVDVNIDNHISIPTRGEILEKYASYCESVRANEESTISSLQHNHIQLGNDPISQPEQVTVRCRKPVPVEVLIAPVYNLFAGEEGCEKFRRRLKKLSHKCTDAASCIRAAAMELPASVLSERRGEYVPIHQLTVHEKMPKVTAPLHSRIV